MKGKGNGRFWLLLAVVLIALIGALWIWRHQAQPSDAGGGVADTRAESQPQAGGRRAGQRAGRRQQQLAPVQAASAQIKSVPRFLNGLGTVTPAGSVTVRSRVDGELMALHFNEGQWVKAGQLLAEIDPRPFNVALLQAKGQLAVDQATLANARQDLARYQQLAKTQLVSRQQLDTQQSQVREAQGTVEVDLASVASADLQLTYSRIIAPMDGRVGLRQVDAGNYITSGDATGIVLLTQTRPIDVLFTLPESDIPSVIAAQKSGVAPLIEVWDRTNKIKLTEGKLLSIDNQIDSATGTVRLKGRFDNDDDSLFPNQFVNIRMKVATLQNAVVIPTAALQMNNQGHFVWVLNDDNVVSQHRVTTGMQDSERVVITAGLQAGQRVVTDGIDRLTDGANVDVVPSAATAQSAVVTPVRHREKH